MTATKIMNDRLEFEKRCRALDADLTRRLEPVLFTFATRVLDIALGRVKAGWPTRGETVEEC